MCTVSLPPVVNPIAVNKTYQYQYICVLDTMVVINNLFPYIQHSQIYLSYGSSVLYEVRTKSVHIIQKNFTFEIVKSFQEQKKNTHTHTHFLVTTKHSEHKILQNCNFSA